MHNNQLPPLSLFGSEELYARTRTDERLAILLAAKELLEAAERAGLSESDKGKLRSVIKRHLQRGKQ